MLDKEQDAKRLGAIFGQAIGDALGIHDEFKPARAIAASDRNRLEYTQSPRMGEAWKPGEWSDDTEQALCILEAYNQDGALSPKTLAKNFRRWLEEDGRGCGHLTNVVLNHPQYLKDPLGVSHSAWEDSNRNSAPNGAVMRVSAVGVLRPWDLDWTERAAVTSALVTHWDPRCVASAVAVATAVACLVEGDLISDAIHEAARRARSYHHEVEGFMYMSLEDLKLDEGMGEIRRPPIGYTYKCLGAGFYALQMLDLSSATPREAFENALDQILAAGGDVDTNAAVAGALLGAAIGVGSLPPNLVHGLVHKERILDIMREMFTKQVNRELARKAYLDGTDEG